MIRSFRLALYAGLPIAAAFAGSASAQTALVNPGFEEGAPALTGWSARDAAGHSVALDSVDAHGGRWAARVAGDADVAQNAFGSVMQRVDAAPFRGRMIRYRAWMRTDLAPGPGRAGLWLRVDRPDGRAGFFENMQARPVRGRTGWTEYEITGPVAPDAEAVFVGLLLVGAGQAWLDDASLQAGEALAPPEPARPLTDRGLQNLVAFSRLLGYVRYFHPSDQAAATDWDAFAIRGVRAVEGAPDARRLAAMLDSLFRPVAPTLAVHAGRVQPAPAAPPADDSLRVVWWRHYGVGPGGPQMLYRSQRIRAPAAELPDSAPDPRQPLRVELGGGVSASIPLGLYANAGGTLPRAPAPPAGAPPPGSGDDRATRLAAVALGWNVFQHFYPYFDVVDADWPAELPRALRAAAADPGECEFLQTLRRMVAALHDGHGSVSHGCDSGQRPAPVLVQGVEGRPTVVAVAPGVEGVRSGDVVLRVDGMRADSLVRARGELVSAATPQWRSYVVHRGLLAGRDSLLRLMVERADGDTAAVVVRRMAQGQAPLPVEDRPEPVAELRPGIWYVDLDRVTDAQLQAALPRLERASGLVFDLRGYPDGLNAMNLFPHLLREPGSSAQWTIPVAIRPDRADVRFHRAPGWPLRAGEPYLSAPRVFITDGRAISYAESIMGIVEAYRLGEIVGGPTAGTNGNVNPFTLPGGYGVSWTGMRVLKHDGSPHHGVGIHPTVPMQPTRAGVAAGRDELLERAVEVVTRAAGQP